MGLRYNLTRLVRTASNKAARQPCRCIRSVGFHRCQLKLHPQPSSQGRGLLTAHWLHPEYPFPPHCPYAATAQAPGALGLSPPPVLGSPTSGEFPSDPPLAGFPPGATADGELPTLQVDSQPAHPLPACLVTPPLTTAGPGAT